MPEGQSSRPPLRIAGWPWCTLAFVALALCVSFGPWAVELHPTLRLEPASASLREPWRALTAPLVHPWPELAVFDLGAIAVLGGLLERRSRLDVAIALPLAALLSAGAVVAWRSDLTSFCGSSALASALFVLLALRLWQSGPDVGRATRWLAALGLGLFAGKLALEATGSWPSPVGLATRGVESVPTAHVAGALAGALASLTRAPARPARPRPALPPT